MSDNNPFAGEKKGEKNGMSQDRFVPFALAAFLGLLALVFLGLWMSEKSGQKRELETLRAELEKSERDLAKADSENRTNADLISSLKSELADVQHEKELTLQKAKSLEDEMRSDLESKDVTISKLQGKLTVNILDRVMFDSGEAVLKPDGAAVMKKIAAILASHHDLRIHVIGHTDNIPIRPSAQGRFSSNWELSTARALAAVHYLTEQCGVEPQRVGAVGYGEFRPLADNSTAEGRARNRRIAITILPDELAAADTPQASKTLPTGNTILPPTSDESALPAR